MNPPRKIIVVVIILIKEKIACILDRTGEECFVIRIDLMKKIKEIEIGEIIQLITDNKKSVQSVPKWCRNNNQQLFLSDTKNESFIYYIKRKS
ncbi:MAG: sulfurtransferase TusA family protein [Candidatus Heimdallarchaeota archaeon]